MNTQVKKIFTLTQVDSSEIQKVQKLWWMSNDNFIVQTIQDTYFVRFEKSNKSDSWYGWNFEKEYKIAHILWEYFVAPKILYYGVIESQQVIVQEYIQEEKDIQGWQDMFLKSFNTFQNIDIQKFPFLKVKKPLEMFLEKFESRIQKDSVLQTEYEQIKKFIEVYSPQLSPLGKQVLVHGDLRKDNTILTQNNCFIIDWEGAFVSEEYLDIVGYYMWNIFFEMDEFSLERYNEYMSHFDSISKIDLLFYSVLQFFSDLTWLENYVRTSWEKGELFKKNRVLFLEVLEVLIEELEKGK